MRPTALRIERWLTDIEARLGRVLINAQIAAPLFPGRKHRLSEKLHSLLDGLWPRNCVHGPTAKPPCIAFTRRCSAPSHLGGGR
jgi:hypothetical protein